MKNNHTENQNVYSTPTRICKGVFPIHCEQCSMLVPLYHRCVTLHGNVGESIDSY